MNNIHTCVERFSSLLATEYEITLGRRNTAVTLQLSFDKEDCFHLMGLQHLKDLPNLKRSRAKVFDDIAAHRIKAETIEASDFFHEIEERVRLLPYLESILDSNDTIFKYNETLNAFSKIQAEFLLDNQHEDTRVFVFLSKRKTGKYCCRSFFPMGTTDFSRNQQKWTLLKKVKRNLETNEEVELYRNPHFKEMTGTVMESPST